MTDDRKNTMQLRPYQAQAIRDVSAAFKDHKSVLLQLPTGAGKTAVAGKMIMDLANQSMDRKGGIGLFLVHRKELITQTVNTLKEVGLGNHVGIIASGYPETPWAPIQIASVFTLVRRLDRTREWFRPRMVIVDEAHHIRANTWEQVLSHWGDAFLLGLTATPARLDGKGLGKHFGKLVEGPTIQTLIKDGYLCPLKNYSVDAGLDMSGVKKSMGEYNKKEVDSRLTNQVIANGLTNFLKHSSERRTIFYAANIRHSMNFVEQCKAAGFRAEHIDGKTGPTLRDAIIKRFAEGQTQVLSNVGIITEGFDCPECDSVMLGWKTASISLYKQMVGRVMRPKVDGRDGIIIDLAGNMDEHGDPEEDVEWTLEDGVIKPDNKTMPDNKRSCKGCGYRFSIRHEDCPACGESHAVTPPEEVNVEVVERDKNAGKRKGSKGRKDLNREVFLTRGDPIKLRAIQEREGYKPGVVRQWKRIFSKSWGLVHRHAGAR